MRSAIQEPNNAPRVWFDIVSAQPKYSDGKVIYSTAEAGSVQWVQNPKATLEINAAGSLSFTIAPRSELYEKIGIEDEWGHVYIVRHTPINQYSYLYGDVIWRGRLYDITIDSKNNKVVTYEGQLSEMNDVIHPSFKWCPTEVPDSEEHDDSVVYGDGTGFGGMLRRLINYYNTTKTQTFFQIEPVDLTYCRVIEQTYMSEQLEDPSYHIFEIQESGIFDIISDLFINEYGGGMSIFYSYDPDSDRVHSYFRYIDAYSSERVAVRKLEFGKNIVDIEKSSEMDEFATVIIPYGRSYTDVDKSWVYMRTIKGDRDNWMLFDPESAGMSPSKDVIINRTTNTITSGAPSGGTIKPYLNGFNSNIGKNEGRKGYYISPEKGVNKKIPASLTGSYYVVFPQISVKPNERYFVTQYIRNNEYIASRIEGGMTPYAIFDKKWTMISSGPTIGKTTTTNDSEEEVDTYEDWDVVDYEISIPEEGAYLKIAAFIPWQDNSSLEGHENFIAPFVIKKYNPHYTLSNETVLMVGNISESTDGVVIKKQAPPTGLFPNSVTDTNPFFTDNYNNWTAIMPYRKMSRSDLISDYGIVEKITEFGESGFDNNRLSDLCKRQLEKLSPPFTIDVEAVDDSLIDSTGMVMPLNISDCVQIISDPHGFSESMDFKLPIKKIELDLQDAANIRIFASNKDDDTLSSYLEGSGKKHSSFTASTTIHSIAHSVISNFFNNR